MSTGNIAVKDLRIENLAGHPVVDGISFEIRPGEAFGLVGESGSGKTTAALAVLGWIRPGLRLMRGSVRVDGEEMLGRSESDVRGRRGKLVAYVPQSAAAALNPSLRVGRQIAEMLRHLSKDERVERIKGALELASLPSDERFQRRFPHQLSGGQQQRLGIAVALACRPKALILDEPTTGLDVITQELVLDEVDRIRAELGISMIKISHDLALVARRTDHLAVMLLGEIVDLGPSRDVLGKSKHKYTRALVDAVPDPRLTRHRDLPSASNGIPLSIGEKRPPPLLSVEELRATHRTRHGTVVAADGVSFAVQHGGCLAIVGESGSGKTTIARCVAGLHQMESGSIRLDGVQLRQVAPKRTREQRRRIQIVFQDPLDSLNPRRSVRDSITRPLQLLREFSRKSAESRVDDLLERVRLPKRLGDAYPVQLSGGECQRVAIARALAADPELLVCDEITSSLDTSVQASVLALIEDLRSDLGLSLLFISHDLGVVATVADDVLVLERGIVCEYGPAERLLAAPTHHYTQRLLASAPSLSASLVEPVRDTT